MQKIVASPFSTTYRARRGLLCGDGRLPPETRWASRTVEFPEITLKEIHARARYSASWGHALLCGGEPCIDHSLVVSMHPHTRESVERRWKSEIEAAGDLPEVIVDGPVYVAANEGAGTWGHWLIHNLPRALTFLDSVPDGRIVLPMDYRAGRYLGCLELLLLFGIPEERLVFVRRGEVLSAPSVWLMDLPYAGGLPHPVVVSQFERVAEALKEFRSNDGQHIFVRRAAENREIANWDDFAPALVDSGFRVVTTQGSLEGQLRVWQSARVAGAVLGSDLTNMILGTAERLFVVTPEWFGDHFFYGLAASLGLEWNELTCSRDNRVTQREPDHRSSFRVPERLATEFFGAARIPLARHAEFL